MTTGTAVAQLIPLAASPILSRLYTPADFGVFSTVLAIASVLAILSTGRYELAVVLPSKRHDALAIAGGVLGLAPAVCGLAWVGLAVLAPHLPQTRNLSVTGAWVHVAPLLALLIAYGSLGSYLANRDRAYRRMAVASVAQQAVTVGTALALGAAHAPLNGLLAGRLAGLLTQVTVLGHHIRAVAISYRHEWQIADVLRNMVRYKQFIIFNLPYSLVGSFSREFVVFALAFSRAVEAAGYYGLVRAVMAAPVSFLSSSLSQVFYREAAERADTKEFSELTFRLLLGMAVALTPGFALISIWGPDMFAVVFGERWRPAGVYAQLLALPALLSVLTSWPERIFEVRGKQSWALLIQVGFDTVSIGVLVWALSLGAAPAYAIGVFAAVQSVYHLCYLTAVFVLVPLPLSKLASMVAIISALAATMWGLDALLAHSMAAGQVLHFISASFACFIVSAVGLLVMWRRRPGSVKDNK